MALNSLSIHMLDECRVFAVEDFDALPFDACLLSYLEGAALAVQLARLPTEVRAFLLLRNSLGKKISARHATAEMLCPGPKKTAHR